MKWLISSRARLQSATILLALSVIGGIYCTVWVATSPYERVLMGISWFAIIVSCLDVISTQYVSKQQEDSNE